jgi:hypothetical protein
MALASILLAVVSFGCAAVGFVATITIIPHLGAAFSFGAPVLALIGVALGGTAMSRAKREGTRTDVARAGVILNVIAFIPGLLIALTCGVCNALFSSNNMHVQRTTQWSTGPMGPGMVLGPDAGPNPLAPPPFPSTQAPRAGAAAPEPNAKPGAPGPSAPTPAPSALPPPPLPAGPGQPGQPPGK